MAAFFVKGKVGLKWQKIDGIEEYRIYRKPSSGEFELIGTSDEDHYFDFEIVPGTTYNYKIAIVDESGKELFSAEKTVTIPGQVGEFLPPVWVGIRADQGKILLNWDAVPSAVAYNIYRSTNPGADYEVVGNSQSSSHVDKADLEVGKTYYYVLTAMNTEFEETAHSEELAVKYGLSKEEREKLIAEQAALKLEVTKLAHLYDLAIGENDEPMNQPADVYANSRGQVYITDALNARVHCYDSEGKYIFTFGEDAVKGEEEYQEGTFLVPFTLHIDKKDQVYVADIERNDIQIFTDDGKFVRCITVKMEEGMKPLRANGICSIDDNRICISDTGNHRFLIIDLDGNILSVKGKQGSAPGDFSFPGEIERSSNDELFLLDVINSRVQVLDLEGNYIRAFGGTGEGAGLFGRPAGLALDAKGRVWVSDNMSAMIQSFTPQGEVKSMLGTAEDEWNFVAPRGIHFVGDRMYIVDRLSNKVMVFRHG
jgi:sugar lactone lactonase YvrE